MDMQIIAIAARRLVVPALLAGITALGITAFAPEAAARDTAPNLARYNRFNEARVATHPSAAPQVQASARTSSAATGTFSQRSGESVGTAKVSVSQLKRYSRFNESRH